MKRQEMTSILLAGWPKTGKTTYMALLYTAISQDRAPGILLGSFRDDREYLNRISRELLQCNEALHTPAGEVGELRLSLEIGDDRDPVLLGIPDVSGEIWEHALYERNWPPDLDQRIATARSILLFLHCHEFDSGPSIAAVRSAAAALLEEGTAFEAGSTAPQSESPTHPSQVQLVDLLQLLCEERGPRPVRAGVILSAWDLTDGGLTPAHWLDMNAPLASQYLATNGDWLHSTVWGVSAQGGSFRDDAERQALLALDAVDRARIVDATGSASAAGDPVKWALG